MTDNDFNGSAIGIQGLSKVYYTGFFRRRTEALKGIDLEVGGNEIMGFLGPNGAGKTTTIKILLGLVYPSGGSATLLGRPLGDVRIKDKIGYMPEQPYFYDYLKGREFLDFYARLHGLSGRRRRAKVEELLEKVGLTQAAGLPLRKFSRGMLQRIGMAQALVGDPELVILDEPMSSLDPPGRRDMREIILELKERGKTVFFSSHILPDVEQICDRICIIHKGKVLDIGRLEDILKPEVEMVDLQFSGLDQAGVEAISMLAGGHPGLRLVEKGGLLLVSASGWEAAERVKAVAAQRGGKLVHLLPARESLEAHFLREINSGHKEGGS